MELVLVPLTVGEVIQLSQSRELDLNLKGLNPLNSRGSDSTTQIQVAQIGSQS
jgi:hypothetical protein